jgi:hypothetical protein
MSERTSYLRNALNCLPEPYASEVRALCHDPQDQQLVDTIIRFASSGSPPNGVVLLEGETWDALHGTLLTSLLRLRPIYQPIEHYFEVLKASLPRYYQPQLRLLCSLNSHAVLSLVSFITSGPPPPPPPSELPHIWDKRWLFNQLAFTRRLMYFHSLSGYHLPAEKSGVDLAPNPVTNHDDGGETGGAPGTGSGGGAPSQPASSNDSPPSPSLQSVLPPISPTASTVESSYKRQASQQDALAEPPPKKTLERTSTSTSR